MLDKELQAAIEKLLDIGVLHANTLKTLANMADLVRPQATAATETRVTRKKRKKKKKKTAKRGQKISKEDLVAFLKDHTGNEAAEHFGVSAPTINNYKKKYDLTKKVKKAAKKKTKKKGKK